jgi:hypothetical protein
VVQQAVQYTAELEEIDGEQKQKSPEIPGFSATVDAVYVGASPFAPFLTSRQEVCCTVS